MRTAIVLGTRPEITKLAPVIKAFQARGADFLLIHTGQHFSQEMDAAFFDVLDLPDPHYNLHVPEGGHGYRTGKMLIGIEETLQKDPVDYMVVHGDTNSTVAGALSAAKLNLPVGHVEAGLRSFDRTMPEEVNRVICDHIATDLFAPTREAVRWLAGEGVTENVLLTGNTIVDSVYYLKERLGTGLLRQYGAEAGKYIFLTCHRQENTDDPPRLAGILDGLDLTARKLGLPIIFAMHPRTKGRLEQYGLTGKLASIPGMRILFPPVGFLESLTFQAHAALVMTDSGGLQEESCILGVPCVTLRDNTERPETLEIGSNTLGGHDPETILKAGRTMIQRRGGWVNPYGDGRSGERIVDAILARS